MVDSLFKRVSDTEDEGIMKWRYQISTTAISVVAPICYAHLAATQMSQFMKLEGRPERSSSHGGTGVTSAGAVPVPQLPKLQENVCNSMFVLHMSIITKKPKPPNSPSRTPFRNLNPLSIKSLNPHPHPKKKKT
ncbi:putative ribonuclease H superfamily [Helianthus annuus]|uniref:Ribonuclease H superfamily n=1 Tax=Helianthus annuus TaxID=4232 RepID=A0A9K3NXF7_HELAN|nr:putative ribonuclease H superfamily [Helianthus annuus]KAJ0594493.1 putative ribonuclease H superfamily [Helianthus annuus]KAJ0602689.1 putative ribonuclease H superfamily [Helianthus annuus]KAJ0609533.1 putative ribonuclease H superfamily [Helianthus annuus]KAJ0769580.1 putative ribonuclease H superfamily [Helianthus annuus]